MNFFQNVAASQILSTIKPTLAGDIFVPDLGRTFAQSPIQISNEISHRSQNLNLKQRQMLSAVSDDASSDYYQQLSRDYLHPGQKRQFSDMHPKDAVRFISDLNSILDRALTDEESRMLGTEWHIERYDRVESARATSQLDASIHQAVFGFPLFYGGYICVHDDGFFVRTAVDPDHARLSLAAGRHGHYLEMSILYWLNGQVESGPIKPDLTDLIRQGYLSTTRYSFSFTKEELAAFTQLPEDIDEFPVIGSSAVVISPLHMAAAQRAQELQFGGIRTSALIFMPVEATPIRDLRDGISDQARVRARHILYQARTGDTLIQPLAETNHYKAEEGDTKRRTVNVYRPFGNDPLMPVSQRLYDELERQLGVKLFVA